MSERAAARNLGVGALAGILHGQWPRPPSPALTEKNQIARFLRDRAEKLATDAKIAAVLRWGATLIARSPEVAGQTAREARVAALGHLRDLAATTKGKPGEAMFVAANNIEGGMHHGSEEEEPASSAPDPRKLIEAMEKPRPEPATVPDRVVSPAAAPPAPSAELPVWLALRSGARLLSRDARYLYQALQRQAVRQTGARWETPFLLDVDALALDRKTGRGDVIGTLGVLKGADLVRLAEAPTLVAAKPSVAAAVRARHPRDDAGAPRAGEPQEPFVMPTAVLLPKPKTNARPRGLSAVSRDLFDAIGQQAILRVHGAYETPFPLDFDTLVQRIRAERSEAIEALRALLARGIVRRADEPPEAPRGRAWSSSSAPVACEVCGEQYPRDPALEVTCPACGAKVGAWCKSPSGHKAMRLHADRLKGALVAGVEKSCPGSPFAAAAAAFAPPPRVTAEVPFASSTARSPFALAAAALAPAPAPRPPAHRTRSPFAAAAVALWGVL
jgi:hypothetical protein